MKTTSGIMAEMFTGKRNFVFIGGTGSGKSEIALNICAALAETKSEPIHFFDLDQTKPLFRSRDAERMMNGFGVTFHYEKQFYDMPTLAPGVAPVLADGRRIAILDVGGNENGARAAGCFSRYLNGADTEVFYIVNPYQPWSGDARAIDETMSQALGAAGLSRFRIVGNPHLGRETTAEEFLLGCAQLVETLSPYAQVACVCVREALYEAVAGETELALFPLKLYLNYPWTDETPMWIG